MCRGHGRRESGSDRRGVHAASRGDGQADPGDSAAGRRDIGARVRATDDRTSAASGGSPSDPRASPPRLPRSKENASASTRTRGGIAGEAELAGADADAGPDRGQLGEVAVGADGEGLPVDIQADRPQGADADGLLIEADPDVVGKIGRALPECREWRCSRDGRKGRSSSPRSCGQRAPTGSAAPCEWRCRPRGAAGPGFHWKAPVRSRSAARLRGSGRGSAAEPRRR